MRDANVKSYAPPFLINQPISNFSVAIVEKSTHEAFKQGDHVRGLIDIATYSILDTPNITGRGVRKLENPHNIDIRHFIGALGMPGLTAYSSFYDIGKPKKGETIFISAASGAVGQVVGQLAKHEGLKVIGSVGDDAKLDFILNELKFDGGFNYKKESAKAALERLAPDGIDIYYENVGGEQLEAALASMKCFGRIVCCGMISQYNNKPENEYGIKGLTVMLTKRLTMRGFIVMDPDMGPVYEEEFTENVGRWIKEGSFVPKIHEIEGIENGPQGLLDVYHGKNFGKALLKL